MFKTLAGLAVTVATVAVAAPAHADTAAIPGDAYLFIHTPNGAYYAFYKDGSHLTLEPKTEAVEGCGHRRPACVAGVGQLYRSINQAWRGYSAGVWAEAAAEGVSGKVVDTLTYFDLEGGRYWVQTSTRP